MSLVRHIAGVPTATEQRCVRCCEVIAEAKGSAQVMPSPFEPGRIIFQHSGCKSYAVPPGFFEWGSEDCKPYDPQAEGSSKSAQEWKDEIHSVAGIL